MATSIGDWAFQSCTRLATVDLPVATSIGEGAFNLCTSLETVDLPVAESIGNSAFYGCTSLETVSLPMAESIGEEAFYNCTSLETVSLPMAEDIDNNAFSHTGTTGLTVTLGSTAPTVGLGLFNNCTSAKAVTVLVPSGATGYGTVPETYTGFNNDDNWGNAFRGKGWNGTNNYDGFGVNSNISLTIDYITP
jgi:hypothetical protein